MASLYRKPVKIRDPKTGKKVRARVKKMVGPIPRRPGPGHARAAGG